MKKGDTLLFGFVCRGANITNVPHHKRHFVLVDRMAYLTTTRYSTPYGARRTSNRSIEVRVRIIVAMAT